MMEDLLIRQLFVELRKAGFNNARYSDEQDSIYPMDARFPDVRIKGDSIIYRNITDSAQKQQQKIFIQKLYRILSKCREIVDAWSNAPPLQLPTMSNFRVLSQFGQTVFAARDDMERGLHFVTWQYNFDRTGVEHGHYNDDYDWSKQDFAVRASLMPENLNYTTTELMRLSTAMLYQQQHDEKLSFNEDAQIRQLTEKIKDAIEGIAEYEPARISELINDMPAITALMETMQACDQTKSTGLQTFRCNSDENMCAPDSTDWEDEL